MRHSGFGVLALAFTSVAVGCTSNGDEGDESPPLNSIDGGGGLNGAEPNAAGGNASNEGGTGGTNATGGAAGERNEAASGTGGVDAGGAGQELAGAEGAETIDTGSAGAPD